MASLWSTLSARPIVLGLAVACAVLALVNGYLLASAVDTSPVMPSGSITATGEQADAGLSTPLDNKPIGEFSETLRRPLFNASRKPVDRPKTATQTGTPTGSPLDMRLVGIAKTGPAPGRALIRLAGEDNGKWIAEGDVFNGSWKLRSVKDRSVVVEADGRAHELKLQVIVRRADEGESGDKAR